MFFQTPVVYIRYLLRHLTVRLRNFFIVSQSQQHHHESDNTPSSSNIYR